MRPNDDFSKFLQPMLIILPHGVYRAKIVEMLRQRSQGSWFHVKDALAWLQESRLFPMEKSDRGAFRVRMNRLLRQKVYTKEIITSNENGKAMYKIT